MDAERIILARINLLEEVVSAFKMNPDVLGIFLCGSLASGTDDEYSDIDLRVVVEKNAYQKFVENRLEIPKQWKGFLFNEWREGTQHCVTHFDQFFKIDLFYLDASNLEPSSWNKLPTKILYDSSGVVKKLIDDSPNYQFDVTISEIDRKISKGLAYIHEAFRRVKRGELLYAQNLLEDLRKHITEIDHWLNFDPSKIGSFKLDKKLSAKTRDTLRASYVGCNSGAIIGSINILCAHLRYQVLELHKNHTLSRPLKNDLIALDLVSDNLQS
jgi:predicted nucleotidyltransferase